MSATQHVFEKNNVLWQVCHNTLLFESQHGHYFFSKDIALCAMCTTQYFWKKNNVLWQVCHNTLFLSHNTLCFQKILCCGRKN